MMNEWKIEELNEDGQYIYSCDGMYVIAWVGGDGSFGVNIDNVFRDKFVFHKWIDFPFETATDEDRSKASSLTKFVNDKCSRNRSYMEVRANLNG